MKKLIILMLMFSTSIFYSQVIDFNKDEDLTLSIVVDPTPEDRGFDLGVEIKKELLWGWVSGTLSHYDALNPAYTALVGSGGLNWNFISENVTLFVGGRAGTSLREDNVYPLLGGVIGFEIEVLEGLRVGAKHWYDYREDNKDEFYGDSDAFKGGLYNRNPLMQENYGVTLVFELN